MKVNPKFNAFRASCLICVFMALSYTSGFGQTPIEKLVESKWEAGYTLDLSTNLNFDKSLKDKFINYSGFLIDQHELKRIYREKPSSLSVIMPTSKGDLEIKLVEVDALSDNFRIELPNGQLVTDVEIPVFYQGVIEGHTKSMASITLSADKITGVASSSILGNLNIVQGGSQDRHLTYFESDLIQYPAFDCGYDESSFIPPPMDIESFEIARGAGGGCIDIHFDCEFDLYQALGGTNQLATDYILAMFNAVRSVFLNESIDMSISFLRLWSSESPFWGLDKFNVISEYASYLTATNIYGDIAHLITNINYGGVAGGILSCTGNSGFAVSGIFTSFEQPPIYSWTVKVISHEIGHNLGSPHTHQCLWNGNDTQIDDCGNVTSQFPNSCFDPDNPIIPSPGGTIMSYCHNNEVGVNLAFGFGTQPGDLIRSVVASALSVGCISSCEECLPIETFHQNYVCTIPEVGYGATAIYTNSGGCDSVVTESYVLHPDLIEIVSIQPCLYENQFSYDTFYHTSLSGCDSLYIISYQNWDYSQVDFVYDSISVCFLSQVDEEVLNLVNNEGCDSIVFRRYYYIDPWEINTSIPTCDVNQVGSEVLILDGSNGCDSTVNINYFFQPLPITFMDYPVCTEDEAGTEQQILTSSAGCDSVIQISYIYQPPQYLELDYTVCAFEDTGTEVEVLTNIYGCDSIVTSHYLSNDVEAGFNSNFVDVGWYQFFNQSSPNATSFYWDFGDGESSNLANPGHQYDHPGIYNVKLIAAYHEECYDTAQMQLDVVVAGLESFSFLEDIQIMPNPNTGAFSLLIKGVPITKYLTIRCYDPKGGLIDSRTRLYNGVLSVPFDLSGLSSGMYILVISDDRSYSTIKFSISH